MRLTGSFQTITIHGLSVTVSSSSSRLLDLDRRGHGNTLTRVGGRSSSAMRLSRPLTNRPESFVEYCLASSTASLITTALGISGSHPSS